VAKAKPKAETAFGRAQAAFLAAKGETVSVSSTVVCSLDGGQLTSTEEFRGESYHILGECSNGHVIERYGYVSNEGAD